MDSQTLLVVVVTVTACALVFAGVWFAVSKTRSRRLQRRFGPEYERVVGQFHDRNLAEAELQNRKERVETYTIVPLSARDRGNYRQAWEAVQRRFVDDPGRAVDEADRLIFEVMERRGYRVNGFEQTAADLSVAYPKVVTHYRAAAAVAGRKRQGQAGTEELRQAVVHYRALFNELLEAPAFTATPPETADSRKEVGGFRLPRLKNKRLGGLRS
ncbi:MAG TPA: hypothetical protein VMT22_00610 [Terriglobales bacterium]|jgi:hypothetical protein|nr:hypothetical protein [Terriglobales bacterium]